jgi:hypothetical protein
VARVEVEVTHWTVESLASRLRQIQYDATMSDEEMCRFLENFLLAMASKPPERHEGVENERPRAT